jgi:L-asparaginase / beta-aspartyl-peptidase
MGIALIAHGGAGDISDAQAAPHRDGARQAARVGWDILQNGGSALDAVQAAIVTMENDPTFDAGIGSFLDRDGKVTLDASIMDGRTLDAGAIAGVERIQNPIRLARRVMESEHTFLIAAGAEQFAEETGIPLIANDQLITPEQIRIWNEWRANPPVRIQSRYVPARGGTVGCVAVDRFENVAAGTSTGGMRFKRPGRVGDSPLIGCGVYADNEHGGASATGWGEAITRVVLSKFAVDALEVGREPNEVAIQAIEHLAKRVGGTGGIILANRSGSVGFAFNTPRMAWAYVAKGMQEIASGC